MPRPLQVIAVSLQAGAGSAGRLLGEVDRLQARGGVRVLDVLLMSKQHDGSIVQASFGDDEDFGALVARLFPLDGGAVGGPDEPPAQLWAKAEALPAGAAMAVLLVEHRWAQGIFDLLDEERGAVLGTGFLTPELGSMIDTEVAAMEEAAASIATAQAVAADAVLRAAAASAQADEVVAASAQIQAAAAAEALRVLSAAGFVEQEAMDEAVDALRASGLAIATADAEVWRALQADASTAAAADEAAQRAIDDDIAAVERADAQRADVEQAASLTPAEIRVLRYLPTKLTFALIADRLGISRAAAKSRAHRAYERLGVHDRAAAVQRARDLGVIAK